MLLRVLTRRITRQIELTLDQALERLANCHTRRSLQTIVSRVVDDLRHVALSVGNGLRDVSHRSGIGDGVANTNTEAVVEQPVVDDHLQSSEELAGCLRALLSEHDVDETTLRSTNSLLLNNAVYKLAVFNEHTVVEHWVVRFRIRRARNVDTARNRQTENLLSGPQRLRLDDGGYRHRPVPFRHPQEDILHRIPVEEGIA